MPLHTTIVICSILTRHIDDELLLPVIRIVELAAVKPAVAIGGRAGRGEGTGHDIVTWIEVEDNRVAGFDGEGLGFKDETAFADVDGVHFSCR